VRMWITPVLPDQFVGFTVSGNSVLPAERA
jgi:hypothetical protein